MAVEEASSSSGGEEGSGSMSGSGSGTWTREQEKAFENALATLPDPDDEAAMWDAISAAVQGKTPEEVRRHYELLVEDVDGIEAGRVPLLVYAGDAGPEDGGSGGGGGKKGAGGGEKGDKGSSKSAEQERRKGIAWTEDEHRLFLLGLEKYGKGDWRSISRNFVISRTPTQVASHAQKYFIRLNSMNRERRRSSIHDITSVNGEASAAQGPITGTNGQAAVPTKSPKQPAQTANPPPGVDAFGTTIGQPVGGPLVSAVGTPVTLPVSAPPHMAYGMHAPVPGTVVPRAPINIPYPMPPPSSR
ncbi:hypothetical protein ACQ4PT_060577 [Festuca glaucescens]